MTDQEKPAIGSLVEGLMAKFRQEELALYEESKTQEMLAQAVQFVQELNPERFFLAYTFKNEQVLRGLFDLFLGAGNHKAAFVFMQQSFLAQNIRHLIQENEGWSCSADKTRFLVKSILQVLVNNTPYDLGIEREHTYHLPTKIFQTQQELMEFFDAIHNLYYGHSGPYAALRASWIERGIVF